MGVGTSVSLETTYDHHHHNTDRQSNHKRANQGGHQLKFNGVKVNGSEKVFYCFHTSVIFT